VPAVVTASIASAPSPGGRLPGDVDPFRVVVVEDGEEVIDC